MHPENKLNAPVINGEYEISNIREISVDWNGWNYRVIYGKHSRGWFIAIPNRNICVRAAPPDDIYYNGEKLGDALNDHDEGGNIASAIGEHWESINK